MIGAVTVAGAPFAAVSDARQCLADRTCAVGHEVVAGGIGLPGVEPPRRVVEHVELGDDLVGRLDQSTDGEFGDVEASVRPVDRVEVAVGVVAEEVAGAERPEVGPVDIERVGVAGLVAEARGVVEAGHRNDVVAADDHHVASSGRAATPGSAPLRMPTDEPGDLVDDPVGPIRDARVGVPRGVGGGDSGVALDRDHDAVDVGACGERRQFGDQVVRRGDAEGVTRDARG